MSEQLNQKTIKELTEEVLAENEARIKEAILQGVLKQATAESWNNPIRGPIEAQMRKWIEEDGLPEIREVFEESKPKLKEELLKGYEAAAHVVGQAFLTTVIKKMNNEWQISQFVQDVFED